MFCCIVLELSKYCTKLYTGSVRCISLSLYQTPFYHKFRSCLPTFAMFVIGASNGFFYFRLRSVKCVLAVYVCAIVVRCCCCCNCLVKSAYIFHHFLGKRFFISGNFFSAVLHGNLSALAYLMLESKRNDFDRRNEDVKKHYIN